jgi:glycosyltransferase involved in cell wall biosynthesis
MKKIISFSIWGENPKYTIGAIKNAELSLEIYPDWICRFYIGKSVPYDIIETLKNMKNTEMILKIKQLLSDDKLRESIGKSGLELSKQHTYEKRCEFLINLYNK